MRPIVQNAIVAAPSLVQAPIPSDLFLEAVRHHQAGQVGEAERLYCRIIDLQPTHAESWSNLGLALMARGHNADAVTCCQNALMIRPGYLEALLNLMTALEGLQQFDKALPICRAAAALAPQRDDLLTKLGVLLERVNKPAEAVDVYQQALALNPGNTDSQFNIARAYNALGKTVEAIAAYRAVIALQPQQAAAYANLGPLLTSVGEFAEAAHVGKRAADLAPDSAETFCNLGVGLQKQGRVAEAVDAYHRALSLNPNYASVHGNLGVAYQELFRFDDAIAALKRAVAINPHFVSANVELIKMRRHLCDWSEFERDRRHLVDLLERKEDAIFMLLLMGFDSTPQQQFQCARQTMVRLNAVDARFKHVGMRKPHRPIRLGYLSNDFRDHPVGRLLPDLFWRHDRSAFTTFGYSMGSDDSGAIRRRIREGCDAFVDLHQLSDIEASDRIHADDIDILIDLTGPTIGSRLDILAARPAPVQVSFLGWPGATGLDCMDYIIADRLLVPFDQQPFYSEKIVHLPDCYQPSDPERSPRQPVTRADCGLPENAFVFCSFNNTVKITPDMFDSWMKILKAVDHGVLWLYCKSPTTIANLQARAVRMGVSPDRIVFASVAAMDLYLGRLQLADLFLDCHPYAAGATCNDALWVGLPVLTLAGQTYVSRMAASLLTAAGLPELITWTLKDYEATAVRLATEPMLLADLRQRLVSGRDRLPLFDMARFVKHLEAAYRTMCDLSRSGEAPRAFAVSDGAMSARASAA